MVMLNGVMTSTIDSAEVATEYFRDYTMEISLLESTHDVGNFERPLKRNLRKFEIKFNAQKLWLQTNKISYIKTITTTGTFFTHNKTEEGVFWLTRIDAFQEKKPNYYLAWQYHGQFGAPEQF